MYSKRATSTSLRVCQFLRQAISVLRDLKKLSLAALSWQLPFPLIDTVGHVFSGPVDRHANRIGCRDLYDGCSL